MSIKIYSRMVTHETNGVFVDRIKVKEEEGKRFVIAYSKSRTKGALVNCNPILVDSTLSSLLDGKGEGAYTLEA